MNPACEAGVLCVIAAESKLIDKVPRKHGRWTNYVGVIGRTCPYKSNEGEDFGNGLFI